MTIQSGTHAIESMQLEERRYPPPPEFATSANAKPDIYDRAVEEFWKDEALKRQAREWAFLTKNSQDFIDEAARYDYDVIGIEDIQFVDDKTDHTVFHDEVDHSTAG